MSKNTTNFFHRSRHIKNNPIISGSVGRVLTHLTIPMIGGLFSIIAFNLADTFFIARLGSVQLAAISFVFPMVMFIGSIATGLGVSISSLISHAVGSGNKDEISRLATNGLVLSFLIVPLFVVAGLLTINPLFTMLGATPEVLPFIREYMIIWYPGMLFIVIPMVGNNIIRGLGDTKTPGLIMTFGATINVILDPILIFGLCGFPRLELAGAAIATVASRALTAVLILSILYYKKRIINFSIPVFKETMKLWKRILHIGIPNMISSVLLLISIGILMRLAARFGTSAVAAFGAGLKIEAFALIVIFALSSITMPFTGQNKGAAKINRILKAHKLVCCFSMLWGFLCVLFFVFTAEPIAFLFSDEPELINNIVQFLIIISSSYGFLGICILTISILNGLQKPISAAVFGIGRMFVLYIPFAWLGAEFFGFKGMIAGMTVSCVIAGIAGWILAKKALAKES